MKGKPITFRPEEALRERLERLAEALDRDFTWLIEKAIEAHLPALEQKYSKELEECELAKREKIAPLPAKKSRTK